MPRKQKAKEARKPKRGKAGEFCKNSFGNKKKACREVLETIRRIEGKDIALGTLAVHSVEMPGGGYFYHGQMADYQFGYVMQVQCRIVAP